MIKVRCLQTGTYINKLHERGTIFEVEEEHFAPNWMERIEPQKEEIKMPPKPKHWWERIYKC